MEEKLNMYVHGLNLIMAWDLKDAKFRPSS